nr:MAG TPA: hypothetical protein [Caudoviricetes sp.]
MKTEDNVQYLWHIKGCLKDLIDYVENPEKTAAKTPELQDLYNVFSYLRLKGYITEFTGKHWKIWTPSLSAAPSCKTGYVVLHLPKRKTCGRKRRV